MGLSPLLVNEVAKIIIGINKPVSFLLMGSGALGCGAAIAANANGAKVLMVDKGKLESPGCLGGGNDHFMAVLDSGPETDTAKAIGDF